MVTLFRLVGAATGTAAIHHPSQDSDIRQSLGFSCLLAAAIGILTRVNDAMKNRASPPRAFAVLGLPLLGGLIVSIVGSTNIFDDKASNRANGCTYLKAGICLFAAGFDGIDAIRIHVVVGVGGVERGSRLICTFTEG